jgi:2-phosphoglycerate kinase
MQLKVIKTDGSLEEYLHTKVIGTLNNALSLIDQPNVFAAEQFAEAITFHLYHKQQQRLIASDEIHLMIQAVLSATGYLNAAVALNQFRLNRAIKRRRVEVIDVDGDDGECEDQPWSKSILVEHLIVRRELDLHTARAIAAQVEDKVLNLGISRVPRSLVRQLVIHDSDMMLAARDQLELIMG